MALILYSKCCTEGFRFHGGTLPTKCPRCQQDCQEWMAVTVDDPKPYAITVNDQRFLRSLRIDAEVLES